MEKEQQSIEQEIQNLQQEKEQLEFILQAHNPVCKVQASNPLVKVKKELPNDMPQNLSIPRQSKPDIPTSNSRPSTLSLLKRDLKNELSSSGVALTTPSSGFYSMTLDTMVDHTGLTPLTGTLAHTGLTPVTGLPQSCSSEVTKKGSTSSESSDGVKSPSSLITL